jgi:hypothetical protein
MNLFVHRDLWRWLNEPFESPPELPDEFLLTWTARGFKKGGLDTETGNLKA